MSSTGGPPPKSPKIVWKILFAATLLLGLIALPYGIVNAFQSKSGTSVESIAVGVLLLMRSFFIGRYLRRSRRRSHRDD